MCEVPFLLKKSIGIKIVQMYATCECILQGVQDQKCQKEMAIFLEGNTFDPTLVKPKCV